VGRDSIIGIASRDELKGPGIPVEANFPHASRPAQKPTPPPTKWVPDLSLPDKAAEGWR